MYEVTSPRPARRVAPRVNHLRNVQGEAITTESENLVNISTWKHGNSGIALGVVAVQVKDAGGLTVTARALIDEGSDASIASREFVRKLGFTRKATELLIATVDGETREKSERHLLKVVTRKNRIRSLNGWTMSKLCATVTPFNWETVQDKHIHLTNLDIKVPPGPIDLLIGMDHAELLMPSEIDEVKKTNHMAFSPN